LPDAPVGFGKDTSGREVKHSIREHEMKAIFLISSLLLSAIEQGINFFFPEAIPAIAPLIFTAFAIGVCVYVFFDSLAD